MEKPEDENNSEGSNEDFDIDQLEDNKAKVISHAGIFVAMARNNKKIKIMEEPIPFSDSMSLLDISLHKKGPMEDKIYTNVRHYFLNIRRGNTVIRVQKPEEEEKLYFCRRGLRKFFDLELEYIKEEDDHMLRNYQRRQKHIILSEALARLEKKQTICLYSLFKENGEHCQIGYISLFDCWIIASKNVCMLVRNEEDLAYYKKERYYWPQLIADVWFKKILNKMTKQEVRSFKEAVDGHTLLGEYCGNPNHQHITIYKELDILFYAIVKNNGVHTCIPPEEAFSIFEKFHLKIVKHAKSPIINSAEELRATISTMLTETASGPMEIYGEGSVVYIVAREERKLSEKIEIKETVLSLCKLKSLEYLIYRKIRELLKKYVKAAEDQKKKFAKFVFELKELCKHHKTPKPLDHYIFFVKTAFEVIDKEPKTFNFDYLYYKFVDFTEFVNKIVDQKVKQLELLKKPEQPAEKAAASKYVDFDYGSEGEDEGNTWVGLEEEEESDNEKNPSQATKPFRIIMITPPLYITEEAEDSLVRILNVQMMETNWREEMKMEDVQRSVVNMHMIPKISEKLGPEVHFVLAGFNQTGMALSLKRLNSLPPGTKTMHPGAFSFVNSKNKSQSLELFFQKTKAFKEHIRAMHGESRITEFEDIYDGSKDEKASKFVSRMKEICEEVSGSKNFFTEQSSSKQNDESFDKNLIVYVLLGIPALGKTRMLSKIKMIVEKEHKEWTFREISSDKIRETIIQGYKEVNPGVSNEKAWSETMRAGKREFFKTLRKMLEETVDLPGRNHVIFVDKNHPPNIISENIDFLRSYCPMEIDMKIIAVLPLSINEFSYSKYTYPFSLSLLFTCLSRAITREKHETLVGDPVHIATVILKFFQMFRNFKFKASLLKQLDFDLALYFPYTEESPQKISDTLIKKLELCLNNIYPGFDPPDSPCFSEFLDAFFASGWEPREVSDSYLEETARTNFLKSIQFFNK